MSTSGHYDTAHYSTHVVATMFVLSTFHSSDSLDITGEHHRKFLSCKRQTNLSINSSVPFTLELATAKTGMFVDASNLLSSVLVTSLKGESSFVPTAMLSEVFVPEVLLVIPSICTHTRI
jgi:hypothetical protein